MKYLSDYVNKETSQILEKYGCFFAFSNEQFEEKVAQGVRYVQLVNNMFVPSEHAQTVANALSEAYARARAQDVEENGITGVIARELSNYECYLVGDITDCVEALKSYNITREQILEVYRANWEKEIEKFC